MIRGHRRIDVIAGADGMPQLSSTAWRDVCVPLMRGLYGWDEPMTRRWIGAFEASKRQRARTDGAEPDFGFWNHRDEREVVSSLMFPHEWHELHSPQIRDAMARAFASMPTWLLVMAPKRGLIWREYRMRIDRVLEGVGHTLIEAERLKRAEVEPEKG